jgi:hypothetical protein
MRTTTSIAAAVAAAALALPGAASAQVVFQTAEQTGAIFESEFSLAPGDVNGTTDAYTRIGGQTKLLTDGTGAKEANVLSASADGTITFFQTASPLVAADTDADSDLYVRRPSGVGLVAPQAAAAVSFVGMTSDGSRAFLRTTAGLSAIDTDGKHDVYEFKTATGELFERTPGSHTADVSFHRVSPNGDVVYFSTGQSLVPGDTDTALDVYTASPAGYKEASPGDGTHAAYFQTVGSANGRVVFASTQQLAPGDTDAELDLYASIAGGSVDLLTPSPNAAAAAKPVSLKGWSRTDAARVVFSTDEKLLPADTDATEDIYAREGQVTTLLTPGTLEPVTFEDFADDGETILFASAEKLKATDGDTRWDMYKATDAGLVHIAQEDGPFDQYAGSLSSTGAMTTFETAEPLSSGDTDTLVDVYLRSAFGLLHASRRAPGVSGPTDHASPQDFLAGGDLLFYTDERLLPEDRNDERDVYSFKGLDLTLVSVDASAPDTLVGAPANVASGATVSATVGATEQASLECRLDGGGWGACGSPWSASGLADGAHVVEARATDVAGNVDASPASAAFTVGAPAVVKAPETTATPSPSPSPTPVPTVTAADTAAPVLTAGKLRVRRRVPALGFSLSEPASVRVVVQRKAGSRWRTLKTKVLTGRAGVNDAKLAELPARGTFRAVVVATDAAGNASAKLVLRPSRR